MGYHLTYMDDLIVVTAYVVVSLLKLQTVSQTAAEMDWLLSGRSVSF